MDSMLSGLNCTWNVGNQVTVKERMICYMGWAMEFVQYMPAKTITHGIKIYAMCCGILGIMVAWNVYTGSEEEVVVIEYACGCRKPNQQVHY